MGQATRRGLVALLAHHWWQARPTVLAGAMRPLAAVYGWLAARRKAQTLAQPSSVPVLVVGNIIVGGAGKTPVVLALVQALRTAGHRPGVISRGHGRRGSGAQVVTLHSSVSAVGDEPLLLRRRSGVPVFVARSRVAAAQALCAEHPEVDVLVADDGLQHHALARQAEVLVFDERGVGNGLLLPAGPLREALPTHLSPKSRVLYSSGQASTPLPGVLALRRIEAAWPLQAWWVGDAGLAQPLHSLRGRPLLAAAGLAAPEKFFAALEAEGLRITRLPLPDHHAYPAVPWPADTPDIITTEKDAVKIVTLPLGATRVWVVPLDLILPAGFVDELLALLFPPAAS